eukprot:m.129527 g.129527  ORF g.129527 m.129527 type:complete len:696 (+) comp29405_c0_seq2:154-2241(+)
MEKRGTAVQRLSLFFPDFTDVDIDTVVQRHVTSDGDCDVEQCVTSLNKLSFDPVEQENGYFKQRKTVWRGKRKENVRRTFHSKTKAGVDDSDLWENETETDTEDLSDRDECLDLFNNMYCALDHVSGEIDGTNAPVSLSDAAGEYANVDGEADIGSVSQAMTTRASVMFPDMSTDEIKAALDKTGQDETAVYTMLGNFLDVVAPVGNLAPSPLRRFLRTRTGELDLMDDVDETTENKQRWRDREDVIAGGHLQSLSAKEVKRQEAIAELAASETAYLSDVSALLELLLRPMQQASIAGHPIDDTISHDMTRSMVEAVEGLLAEGESFLKAMTARQQSHVVVSKVSDIFCERQSKFLLAFSRYCSTCFYLQQMFRRRTPALLELCKKASLDPRSRNLPPDSLVLVPIQRVARYPLLIQAISDRTDGNDFVQILEALSGAREVAHVCNSRLRSLEDHATLQMLETKFDTSRLEEYVPLVHSERSLVKRERLQLVDIEGENSFKISHSRTMEFFLFSDMLLYARPANDTKYIVYKQIHRSLVGVSEKSPTPKTSTGPFLLEFILYGDDTKKIYVNCKSETQRKRWLDALHPPLEEEQQFALWDCPQGRAICDHESTQPDELTLRRGDIINIISRGDNASGMYKGVITGVMKTTHRNTTGWFPRKCIKEIINVHQEAKIMKANYKMQQMMSGNHRTLPH